MAPRLPVMRHLPAVLWDYSYHCTRDASVSRETRLFQGIAVAGDEAAWNATGRGAEAGGVQHIQKVQRMAGMLRLVWAGQDSTLAFLVLTACWWPRR